MRKDSAVMVARATGDPAKAYTTKLRAIAAQLDERMAIPQVQRQRELVTTIIDNDDYLAGLSVTALERMRVRLRDLIRFIADSGTRRIVITDLTDPLIERAENRPFDIAEHYDD